MSIKIRKGENINLTKTEPGLQKVLVGLGWDTRKTDGKAFDLDASCFLVTPAGTVAWSVPHGLSQPRVVDSGIGPRVLEYIDLLTMSAMTTCWKSPATPAVWRRSTTTISCSS